MSREVTRRWAALVDELDLPNGGCSVQALVDAVAAHRGRPIVLVPVTQGSGPSGCVFIRAAGDVIHFGVDGGGRHQANTVAHELAHLLLQHTPQDDDGADVGFSHRTGGAVLMLNNDILDIMRPGVLCRTTFGDEPEDEAETLAWLLLDRIRYKHAAPSGPLTASLVHRPGRRRRRWSRRP